MICVRCGGEVSATSPCSRCGTALDPVVATGILTPHPALVTPEDGATGALDSPPTGLSDAPTGLGGSTPLTANSGGPLRAGQAFGSRYHIVRALGVGGMGAVYQ